MILGITGGIGTGKSTVLGLLKDKFQFYVIEADKVGHMLMKKGEKTYEKIVKAFGNEILDDELEIDRRQMGKFVFDNKEALIKLNNIVHPDVIKKISEIIEIETQKNKTMNFVIEAALLIESGCDKLCDNVWYVYSNDQVRIERLQKGRGMSEKDIKAVMENQLSYIEFEKGTNVVIDNSFSIDNTCAQIEKLLEF